MLPDKYRLIKKNDFDAVYRQGKFFSLGNVSIKVKKNDLGWTRAGVAVGIKFSKKATARNRAKRQIRETLRLNWRKIRTGLDLVVMVKPSGEKFLPEKKLALNLEALLEREKLIS